LPKNSETRKPVSAHEIFGAISDSKSLLLFNILANEGGSTESLVPKLGISRKEYYLRISKLLRADVIRRKNKEYCLTIFGRVIHGMQLILAEKVDQHLKKKTRPEDLGTVPIPTN
jgi:predicted transcriptional regulator